MSTPSQYESDSVDSISTSTITNAEFIDDLQSIPTTYLEECTTLGESGGGDNEDIPSESENQGEGWKLYLGVLYTIYAICMTSLGVFLLGLLPHVHPLTISLYSFPIGICTSAPFVWYKYKVEDQHVLDTILPLLKHKRILFFMWLRSTCTVMLTFTLCWTVPYASTSDITTIFAATVITVNVVGSLWFKEKLGIVKLIVCIMIIFGVAIMNKSPFLNRGDIFNNMNLLAVCGMLFASVSMLVLRYLHHVYHGVRNTFLFAWGFLSILPFAIVLNKLAIPNYTSWDVAGITGYGILLSLNNIFFSWALKEEEAGVVALVRTGEFVFACFWKMILLKKYLDLTSSFGAVLACSGVILVLLRKWLQGKEEDRPVRKRMKWIFW